MSKNSKVFQKNAVKENVRKKRQYKFCVLAVDKRYGMGHDEHEMLIEFSEMTAFNFNSKEYQEVREDLLKCKKVATGFEAILQNFVNKFRPEPV